MSDKKFIEFNEDPYTSFIEAEYNFFSNQGKHI